MPNVIAIFPASIPPGTEPPAHQGRGLPRTGGPVSALPSQVEMLELPELPLARHDFHFLTVRRLRRDRICGLLCAGLARVSGPVAGLREPVLLRVRPA